MLPSLHTTVKQAAWVGESLGTIFSAYYGG
ncbi:hypothetical protein A2U01_0038705, partial [Trifolium medium]|nr:hypothetical protein [Trifolium medium]